MAKAKKKHKKHKARANGDTSLVADVQGLLSSYDSPKRMWKQMVRTVQQRPWLGLATAAIAIGALLQRRRAAA